MNFPEIHSAIKHVIKTSDCLHCKSRFKVEDIHVVTTTRTDGLFDVICHNCKRSSIVTVSLTPKQEIGINRHGSGISHNDVLDIKNFLNHFDGNFKKLFIKEQ